MNPNLESFYNAPATPGKHVIEHASGTEKPLVVSFDGQFFHHKNFATEKSATELAEMGYYYVGKY